MHRNVPEWDQVDLHRPTDLDGPRLTKMTKMDPDGIRQTWINLHKIRGIYKHRAYVALQFFNKDKIKMHIQSNSKV